MHRLAGIAAVITLVLPGAAFGQATSVADIPARVPPGEAVSVTLTGGASVVGVMASASDTSVTLMADGRPVTFAAPEIVRVTRVDGGHATKKGILLGAPLGALAGSSVCYQTDPPPSPSGFPGTTTGSHGAECALGMSVGAVIGGGIGAALGHHATYPTVVYEAPAAKTPPAEPQEGVVLPAAAAQGPSSPNAIARRLYPFDTVYITLEGGRKVNGHFWGTTPTALLLEHEGRTQQVTADDILEVRRRGPNQARKSAIVGGVVLGSVCAVIFSAYSGSAAGGVFGFVMGAPIGALEGAAVGLMIHSRPVVYRR